MTDHPAEAPDELAAIRAQLAAIEHERWAHWQKYVHDRCTRGVNGSLVIPAALVERWERQIATPYADLSEREQLADLAEVDRYWPIIQRLLDAQAERLARAQRAADAAIGGLDHLANQRDRLATTALAVLSEAGLRTPVEGYAKAPELLGPDLAQLVRDRDRAQADLAAARNESEALKKVCAERYDALMDCAKDSTGHEIRAMQAEHQLSQARAETAEQRDRAERLEQENDRLAIIAEAAGRLIQADTDWIASGLNRKRAQVADRAAKDLRAALSPVEPAS